MGAGGEASGDSLTGEALLADLLCGHLESLSGGKLKMVTFGVFDFAPRAPPLAVADMIVASSSGMV